MPLMRYPRFSTCAMAIAGALAVVGCAEPVPTAPSFTSDPRSSSVPGVVAGQGQPDDPNLLGRGVPGFGGFFYDDSGAPTAYLREPRRRAELERVMAPFLRTEGLLASSLRVLPGDFEFVQLERWFGNAAQVALEVPGAVFADLDERSNRLRIGVEHPTALAAVQSRIAGLGIPPAAVTIEQTAPIRLATTLRDKVRPVIGGLEINYTGGWRCTLGFNATSNMVSSFVTASHCSTRYGGDDGTLYTQPDGSMSGTPLGTEVSDPDFFTGGTCARGRRCRYSDAARATYAAGVPFTLGRIAKTTGVNDGSIQVEGSFSISRESSGSVGSRANKVGRTSGWSQGKITRTCVATNVFATSITLLCQHWVDAAVDGGDSGAPVFITSGRSGVSLAGILWGGNSAGTTFIFSPIANIEQELGSLLTS